jgi:transposase-like protein
MANQPAAPKTLMQAIRYYSNPDRCLEVMVEVRWPKGVTCPTCGKRDVRFISTRRMWECKNVHPRRQFSVKVGTIFEDSPLGLDKWLAAVWMIANCKNGVSSYEIHRALGITQKSAWFMLHRIRAAMHSGTFEKMRGTVEADETFVGGRAQNMHKGRRKMLGAHYGKTVVMGLLDRTRKKVRAKVVGNTTRSELYPVILQNVEPGSQIMTDALMVYRDLPAEYIHQFVDHTVEYVRGRVHTNGLENFWALLKRAIRGTYVSVAPVHLGAYVDEEAFRYNERIGHDGDRFIKTLGGIVGRRLTYKRLTGKALGASSA